MNVQAFRGRILDCDSHEMTPVQLWPETFGEVTKPFAAAIGAVHAPDAVNSLNPDVASDSAPINEHSAESAWGSGAYAPGAFDMKRRLEFLDYFGIERTFVFPTAIGALGFMCASEPPPMMKTLLNLLDVADPLTLGREMCKVYNDWCIEIAKLSPRLRPVAAVETTDLTYTIDEIERVIDGGVRAVWIPSGLPPGGMSPGHRGVDPLWRVFNDAHVPVLFHVGGDLNLLRSDQWAEYGFDANVWGASRGLESPEVNLDPYTFATLHLGVENFLTAMIYGGVFERFPELFVGTAEVGAYWVGPMCENVDNIAFQFKRVQKTLSMKPSEYLQRNVRVAPFFWEPVDKYIERYGIVSMYTFGSDYPHFEGGKDPLNREAAKFTALGSEIAAQYFFENAEVLLPA